MRRAKAQQARLNNLADIAKPADHRPSARHAGGAAGFPCGAGGCAQADPGAGPFRGALGADRPRPGRTRARKCGTGPSRTCRATKAGSSASASPAYASASNRRWTSHRQKDVSPARGACSWKSSSGAKRRRPAFSERECLSKLEDNARAAATATSQLRASKAKPPPRAPKSPASATRSCGSSCTPRWTPGAPRSRRWRNGEMRWNPRPAELRSLDEQRLKLEQGIAPLRDGSTTCGSRRRPPR
jgi:hypothetical protein